jgi:spermidine/putrescine transport system permease protein
MCATHREKASFMVDVKSQPGFKTITILCLGLLYTPILVLVLFAFNAGDLAATWDGFSFKWFGVALQNPDFHSAAKNTLAISAVATIVSTSFATMAAIGMTRVKAWPGLAAALMIVNLPLMVPEIITAVATLSFFAMLAGAFGLNFGIGNIMLAHIVFCIPFAFMPIRARLEDMDMTLENASHCPCCFLALPLVRLWLLSCLSMISPSRNWWQAPAKLPCHFLSGTRSGAR